MRRFIETYAYMYVPAILAFLVIIIKHQVVLRAGLIEDLMMITLIVFICQTIKNFRIRYLVQCIGLFFITAIIATELIHYYLFKNLISASTIFILIETYSSEVSEFVSIKFDRYVILILLVFLLNLILGIRSFYRRFKRSDQNEVRSNVKSFAIAT